jgi:hypothetical protein
VHGHTHVPDKFFVDKNTCPVYARHVYPSGYLQAAQGPDLEHTTRRLRFYYIVNVMSLSRHQEMKFSTKVD